MRLLAITTSFPLRRTASAGVFVRRLYEHLPDHWHVDVLCPDDDDVHRDAGASTSSRIRLVLVRYAPRRWQVLAQQSGGIAAGLRRAPWRVVLIPILLLVLWLRCASAARRADLLHANWAICGAIAASVGVLTGRPVVTTLRGDDVTRARRSAVDRWILDVAVRGSAAVVCVSEAMAEEVRALYPGECERVYTCLNGVDSAFLTLQRSTPKPDRLRVIAIGSLIRRKGFDILIDSVARMRYRDAVSVRIVGAGPERAALSQQADRLGIADRIEFVGEVAPLEVPALLADADVFVLPSRSEGRPNVVLEALAAGLPVIASALPGLEGLVRPGVNGWCVAVGDASGLAMALDEASERPHEREGRAAAARAGILQMECDWGATARRYDTVFARVLAKDASERHA